MRLGARQDAAFFLGDEGVDLVGLLDLVALAVNDGDFVAHIGQILFQLGAVQGHEVVVILIDGDADVEGFAFGGYDGHQAHHHHGREYQRK